MRNRFFLGMSCVLLLIVFAGFARTFYLRPLFDAGPELPAAYVHGAVMTAWYVIFFIQTSLVAAHRTDIHRQLGVVGATVGVGVVVMAGLVTTEIPAWLSTQGYDFTIEANLRIWSQIVWSDFGSTGAFALFFGSAIFLRRTTDIHKRLMLLASISILGPALSRISSFPIFDAISNWVFSWSGLLILILALGVHDLIVEKRVHVVTAIGGPLILVVRYVFSQVIGSSEFGRSVVLGLSVNG